MKRLVLFALVMVALAVGCRKNVEKPVTKKEQIIVEYINSFQQSECEKITLELYEKMSDIKDGKRPRIAIIDEAALTQKVVKMLKALPDKGDMMIKMGNVQLLKVTLHQGAARTYFHYYGTKVKAPDTAFYSNEPPEVIQLHTLFMEQFK